jgi:UDP-glucose 6-dehydrogenase
MKVAIVGTRHVGLATCVSLAAVGHDVLGTDVDRGRVEQLQRGDPEKARSSGFHYYPMGRPVVEP